MTAHLETGGNAQIQAKRHEASNSAVWVETLPDKPKKWSLSIRLGIALIALVSAIYFILIVFFVYDKTTILNHGNSSDHQDDIHDPVNSNEETILVLKANEALTQDRVLLGSDKNSAIDFLDELKAKYPQSREIDALAENIFLNLDAKFHELVNHQHLSEAERVLDSARHIASQTDELLSMQDILVEYKRSMLDEVLQLGQSGQYITAVELVERLGVENDIAFKPLYAEFLVEKDKIELTKKIDSLLVRGLLVSDDKNLDTVHKHLDLALQKYPNNEDFLQRRKLFMNRIQVLLGNNQLANRNMYEKSIADLKVQQDTVALDQGEKKLNISSISTNENSKNRTVERDTKHKVSASIEKAPVKKIPVVKNPIVKKPIAKVPTARKNQIQSQQHVNTTPPSMAVVKSPVKPAVAKVKVLPKTDYQRISTKIQGGILIQSTGHPVVREVNQLTLEYPEDSNVVVLKERLVQSLLKTAKNLMGKEETQAMPYIVALNELGQGINIAAFKEQYAVKPQQAVVSESVQPTPLVRAEELEIVNYEQPIYPTRARRAGTEGWVEVNFTVREDGKVKDISVIDAQPKGVFEKSATQALKRWRFAPMKNNTRSRASLTLHFELK